MAAIDLTDSFETWKPVSFAPEYEASNLGHVRHAPSGRIIGQRVNAQGYYECNIRQRRKRTSVLVCDAFHGPRPSDQHWALHGNGVRTDNRSTNLRWGTQQENRHDMIAHGTILNGEKNHNAKLTDELAEVIRATFQPGQRRPDGLTQRMFAERHGVSQTAVHLIVTGRSWKHVA